MVLRFNRNKTLEYSCGRRVSLSTKFLRRWVSVFHISTIRLRRRDIGSRSLRRSIGVKVLLRRIVSIGKQAQANLSIEDYYATIYSAEIVNSLTNLLFIYLGVRGIRNCLKYDHDRVFLVSFMGCEDFNQMISWI